MVQLNHLEPAPERDSRAIGLCTQPWCALRDTSVRAQFVEDSVLQALSAEAFERLPPGARRIHLRRDCYACVSSVLHGGPPLPLWSEQQDSMRAARWSMRRHRRRGRA